MYLHLLGQRSDLFCSLTDGSISVPGLSILHSGAVLDLGPEGVFRIEQNRTMSDIEKP